MKEYFTTDYQRKIFEDRYAQTKEDGTKETIEETFERISLGDSEVYQMLINKEFIPAGRILSNVGGNGNNMVGNCFYIPILEDSLDGIMKRQSDTVKVFAKGGGVGTNFSTLRPKNAPVQGAQTGTSGPCSFIDATEGYSKTIKQGGSRRAATIIIMNCDHPDIFEFVTAKTDHARWSTANVSVGIYDSFMQAVVEDGDWDLKFNGRVYRTIKARELWDEICRCAWQSAEPGVVFLDTINEDYPVNYKYKIEGTNPCGEIPLQNYGMCLLGSMILPTFVRDKQFDFDAFAVAVKQAVRYLDSLIDITTFPIPEVEEMMLKTRPIGLGATGLADALFLLGIPYGNNKACLDTVSYIVEALYTEARRASEELAEEKGAFPDYDSSKASYASRRNSTLISFAPTGTISGLVGCSYGIEPHFAPQVTRNEDLGRDVVGNPIIDKYMRDNKLTTLPAHARFVGGSTEEHSLTVTDHLKVLNSLAKWVDNAISKTTNLPQSATIKDVSDVFMYCWDSKIKGVTVYRDGCREDQPVSWNTEDIEDSDEFDDYDIEDVDYIKNPKDWPVEAEGCVYKLKFHPEKPSMLITIVDLEEEPLGILFKVNNATHQEYLDGLSRSITSLWRRGIRADHLFEEFSQYQSPNAFGTYMVRRDKGVMLHSILHGIALVIKKHFRKLDFEGIGVASQDCIATSISKVVSKDLQCPNCQELTLKRVEGCLTCTECGYSKCG